MTDAVTFRPWTEQDLPRVIELESRLFPLDAWSEEMFYHEFAHATTRHYLVVEAAGAIVGYAGLMAVHDVADIQTIGLEPAFRGRGLGRTLLRELLDEAARRGARRTLLEVRHDNTTAIHLYESEGFAVIARRRRYYRDGVDALVMERTTPETPATTGENP